jgi:hypothetical protein
MKYLKKNAASVFRMDGGSTILQMSVNIYRLHGVTFQTTVLFIGVTVGTSELTRLYVKQEVLEINYYNYFLSSSSAYSEAGRSYRFIIMHFGAGIA